MYAHNEFRMGHGMDGEPLMDDSGFRWLNISSYQLNTGEGLIRLIAYVGYMTDPYYPVAILEFKRVILYPATGYLTSERKLAIT